MSLRTQWDAWDWVQNPRCSYLYVIILFLMDVGRLELVVLTLSGRVSVKGLRGKLQCLQCEHDWRHV